MLKWVFCTEVATVLKCFCCPEINFLPKSLHFADLPIQKYKKKPEGQLWISYTIEYQQRIHWTTFKATKFSGLEHFFSFMYDFSKRTTKILIRTVFLQKIILFYTLSIHLNSTTLRKVLLISSIKPLHEGYFEFNPSKNLFEKHTNPLVGFKRIAVMKSFNQKN